MLRVVLGKELANYRRTLMELDPKFFNTASEIIDAVKSRGDEAVIELTRKFDKVEGEYSIKVEESEFADAKTEVSKHYSKLFDIFMNAARNLRAFHIRQKQESWYSSSDELTYGQKIDAIERVGVYVPGGKAFLLSTALMNIVPAQAAGVDRIVIATPPNPQGKAHPLLLALADELNVREIYKVGGAQAIAAFAFGTKTIPAVYKITGPGNAYVIAAKKLVSGTVGIDSLPGPSEVAILADDSANPEWVAIDLCAQAEHDDDTTVFLVSPSRKLIDAVNAKLNAIVPTLKRREVIEKSLSKNSYAVLTDSVEMGYDIVNRLAPEHTEAIVERDTLEVLAKLKTSGAVFVGSYSPVATGDYYAGPNHILPTNGTAVFSSPVGVYDFIKRTNFLKLSDGYIGKYGPEIEAMAEFEGLEAHSLSVKKRRL